ncbi:thymidylate synthase [Caudoviricetes sp.]|nr:thymidylate synthase [Caudoviricetes sp.]
MNKHFEIQYADLVRKILTQGSATPCRNGSTLSLFGETIKLTNITKEFPIIAGRKIHWKPVLGELAAFFRGPKHVNDFKQWGCNYWDKFADNDGNLYLDYGNAWTSWYGTHSYLDVDQLSDVVASLKLNPHDRRHIITGWNPVHAAELSLPCCHLLYQWRVANGKLDMIWYQRSCDTMLGLPSDMILAAAWNILMAQATGYTPGDVTMMLGDTHIYQEHIAGANQYLQQASELCNIGNFGHLSCEYVGAMTGRATMTTFEPDELYIYGYTHLDPISFELKV